MTDTTEVKASGAQLVHSTYASGLPYVIVQCDDCGTVMNSGHHYDPREPHAQAAADQHNAEHHTSKVKPDLPSVRFDKVGEVTAANAVRVEEPDSQGWCFITVLHPQGGRIGITWEPTEVAAQNTARDLQAVLTAWVELSR